MMNVCDCIQQNIICTHFVHSEDIIDDIGDVDTDLTGADEDELLLSDDGETQRFIYCLNIGHVNLRILLFLHRIVLMQTIPGARGRLIIIRK